MQELTHVPVDNSWFQENREKYLNSQAFQEFQAISGVNLEDLTSDHPGVRQAAQTTLASRSVILNAIRNTIGDYFCPLTYMHALDFAPSVPDHIEEIDRSILAFDMSDSLRRRHFAISCSILPETIKQLRYLLGLPLTIKNLGAGLGIDVLNAVRTLAQEHHGVEYVAHVLNYDIDRELLNRAHRVADYALRTNLCGSSVRFKFETKNLFMDRQKADLVVLAGIICGLTDDFATDLLRHLSRTMTPRGALIVTSSNYHMRCTDPLASLLIQNIGLHGYDPLWGWPLNFRTREQLEAVLDRAGFASWQIYDDANFPGRETIDDKMYGAIDSYAAIALGLRDQDYQPLRLPPRQTLEKKTGYNWIAVAWKSLPVLS